MKLYAGVTDNGWFNFLRAIGPEDINFWQPGGNTAFKVIPQGAPFLFKLKSPLNAIGGVGFFSSHTFLPITVAWDTFGIRNGCRSFEEFRGKILGYRKSTAEPNPVIGCVVLTSPVFFRAEDWIKTPADWSASIVQGKSYSTADAIGNALWQEVQAKLDLYRASVPQARPGESLVVNNDSPLYGNPTLTKVRIGQGAFRVLVMDGYGRRCSITGERTLPVLEAAHIQSYADAGPNALNNGILLRSDMHKLFDTGYLTVTKDLTVEVSKRINQEFHNGREYYKHHGQKLLYLPGNSADLPDAQYLDWHNTNCFKG